MKAINAKRVGSVLLTRGFGSFAQFCLSVALGRTLGSDGTGLFFLFSNWSFIVATIGGLGLATYVLRNVSAQSNSAVSASTLVLKAIGRAAGATTFLGLFIGVGSVVAASASSIDAAYSTVLLYVAVAACAFAILRIASDGLKANGQPLPGLICEFALVPALTVGALIASISGGYPVDVELAMGVYSSAAYLSAVVAVLWITLRSRDRILAPASIENRELPRFWLISMINILMMTCPYLLLPLVATESEMGQFGVAHRLIALSATIIAALASIFGPAFARCRAQGDLAGLHALYSRSRTYTFACYLPLFAVYVAFPGEVLGLFGDDFAAGSGLLVILAVGRLINSATGLTEHFLTMTGGEREEIVSGSTAVLFFLAAGLALGRNYGVDGIATAYAMSFGLRSVCSFYFVRRRRREVELVAA